MATGVFVFSLAFLEDFLGIEPVHAQYKPVLVLGWVALLLSILAGILHMRAWALYYTSWGTQFESAEGRSFRRRTRGRLKVAEAVQFFGFGVGLLCLLMFAAGSLYPPVRVLPERSSLTD